MIRVAVTGAKGRMGSTVVQAVEPMRPLAPVTATRIIALSFLRLYG